MDMNGENHNREYLETKCPSGDNQKKLSIIKIKN